MAFLVTGCSRGADVPAQEEGAETPTQPNIIVVLDADLDHVLAERMSETRSLLVEEVPPPKTLLSATQLLLLAQITLPLGLQPRREEQSSQGRFPKVTFRRIRGEHDGRALAGGQLPNGLVWQL